jgi:hypothetical protein
MWKSKRYKCIKSYYIEDVCFAKEGDIVDIYKDTTNNLFELHNTKTGHYIKCYNIPSEEILLKYFIDEEPNNKLEDSVSHPKHYTSHPSGIECIDITRHYCFSIGNAIKYLWRAGLKKDSSLSDKEKEIEDLNKAIWYINDRIKELKNGN